MALKAILDSLDELPEEIKSEYVEGEDGKFILNVTPVNGFELKQVDKLMSALSKARGLADENYKKLKAFGDLDPEEIQTKLSKLDEIQSLDPEKKIQEATKARLEEINRKHNAEKDELSKQIQLLTSENHAQLLDVSARKALSEKGVKSVELALPHLLKNARVRRNDAGRNVIEIFDNEGNVRVGDVHGNPMNFTHLLDEMESDQQFSPIFPGTGSSGSGSQTTNNVNKADSKASNSSQKSIDASDQNSLNLNIEGLASGETVVTHP